MEIQSAIDLIKYDGLWPTHGGGSLEATEEIMAVASFPQAPYVSTTIGTHTHPRSEHLGSLACVS